MSGTNRNAQQVIRHHSKHALSQAIELDYYIDSIGSTMREPLVVLDQNLQIHSANRAFCNLLDLDIASVKGCHCYELSNRALDTPAFRRLLEEVLLKVSSVEDFEVTHNLAGGGTGSLLINARVIGREPQPRFTLLVLAEHTERSRVEVSGLTRLNEASPVLRRTRDLTEGLQAAEFVWRSRMDQQLREQEALVNSILDTAADAIITLEGKSHIIRANAATEKMFGYNSNELIGRSISILMPAVTGQEIKAILKHQSEPSSARIMDSKREFLGVRKCGSSFPLELSASEVDHLGIFTIIVRDISDRCRLQREIMTVAEDEQRKIGQELHDSAQQELTAVSLLARVLLDHLNGHSSIPQAIREKCADIAEKIISGVKRANEEVRQISHGLIPVQLDAKGLVRELKKLALETDALKSVRCTFSSSTSIAIADDFTATHLFKIAQEAVTNCLKHAHAKHIHIALHAEESAIVLCVSDDGNGINEHQSRGVGLRSLEYRAHLINGILKLTNLEQGGSLLTCTVFNSHTARAD